MKTVRSSHPAESNILLLSYVFFIACFFSYQMLGVTFHDLLHWHNAYIGIFLMGVAATVMVLIVWEEMVFPVKAIPLKGGWVFKNHRTKLKTQILLYSIIPAIICFVYFQYEVNRLHFILWALVCMVPPIVEKLVSGLKNYNDFLTLTPDFIEYKNNEKEGRFEANEIQSITPIDDENSVIKKIQLLFTNKETVVIDLHEMELEDFYDAIDAYITANYQHWLHVKADLK